MNALMLMMYMGRGVQPHMLHEMVKKDTERRVKIFTKIADILFGVVMFFFSDVEIQGSDGKVLSSDDFSKLSTEDKLNAIMGTQKSTDKALRFRELFRPILIAGAEFIAEMMAPDPAMLSLLTGGGLPGLAGGVPAGVPLQLPAGQPVPVATPVYNLPVAGSANPNAQQGSAGNPIRVPAHVGGSY